MHLMFFRRQGRGVERYNARALPTTENDMPNQASVQDEFLQALIKEKSKRLT
jgi:hypothetical protein